MTGRSHLVLGTVTAATGTAVIGCTLQTATTVIAAAIATAKLPDMDMRVGIRHRGPTHTLIALLLVAGAFLLGLSISDDTAAYATAGAIGALIGYGLHLVADACTPHGVPVFAPFYREDVHLLPKALRIVTGSWQELFLVALLAAGMMLLTANVLGAL